MKALQCLFILTVAVVGPISAQDAGPLSRSSKPGKCSDGRQVMLENLDLDVLFIEPADVYDEKFSLFLWNRRYQRLQHLQKMLGQVSGHASLKMATIKRSENCISYSNSLRYYSNLRTELSGPSANSHLLLGAVIAAQENFPLLSSSSQALVSNSTSASTLRLIVILGESFTDSPDSGLDQFSCTSREPSLAEAANMFEERGITVFFISPNQDYIRKWNAGFVTTERLQFNFPSAFLYPPPEVLNSKSGHVYYHEEDDTLEEGVRYGITMSACSRFLEGTIAATLKPSCLENIADYELEVVWLFNPNSLSQNKVPYDTLDAFVKPLLKSLKQKFSKVKTAPAMYGENVGAGCYQRIHQLTDSDTHVAHRLRNVKFMSDGRSPKASFLGASLAVSDDMMGWSRTSVNKEGKKLLKMILLLTDDFPSTPDEAGSQRATGDVSDTCMNSDTPTARGLGKILRDADVMLGVLLFDVEKQATWSEYVYTITQQGAQAMLQLVTLPDNAHSVQDLRMPFDGLFCDPTTTTPAPTTPRTTTTTGTTSTVSLTTPATPSETPATPSETPATPSETPATPSETPDTPSETPDIPPETTATQSVGPTTASTMSTDPVEKSTTPSINTSPIKLTPGEKNLTILITDAHNLPLPEETVLSLETGKPSARTVKSAASTIAPWLLFLIGSSVAVGAV